MMESAANEIQHQTATRLSSLDPDQAIAEWDVLATFFEKALTAPSVCGRMTLENVKKSVEDGNSKVVIAWDPDPKAPVIYAAFLIEANQYPSGKKVFSIALCGGGGVEHWGHLYPDFRRMATELGFDQLEISGRPGWAKFIGAKEVSRKFVEELKHG